MLYCKLKKIFCVVSQLVNNLLIKETKLFFMAPLM